MSISDLTIGGDTYTVYASLAEALQELRVDPKRGTAWTAATDDNKSMYLVAATQRLNLLPWLGEKTGAGDVQKNAFPRTGLVYRDGTAVTTSDVPYGVQRATALLAGSIAINGTVADADAPAPAVKRVKAGSAEVEFATTSQQGTMRKLIQDDTVYELVREWLTGTRSYAGVGIGPAAFGTDGVSSFDTGYKRSRGFS